MRFLVPATFAVSALLLFGSASMADPKSPFPEHPTGAGLVNDFAHVLSIEQKDSLEQELRALEHDTQVEFAVVTVTSLNGMEVEPYANGLARSWGIGKQGAHNGLLFLTSPSDHRQRIEVGSRLEGILTDADSKDILHQHYHPHAIQKDVPGAVVDTTQALDQFLRQRLTPDENKQILSHKTQPVPHGHVAMWIVMFFIGILVVGSIWFFSRREKEPEVPTYDPDEEYRRAQRRSDIASGAVAGAAMSSSRYRARDRSEDDTRYTSPSSYTPSPDYGRSSDTPSSPSVDTGFTFGGDSGGGFDGGGASGND